MAVQTRLHCRYLLLECVVIGEDTTRPQQEALTLRREPLKRSAPVDKRNTELTLEFCGSPPTTLAVTVDWSRLSAKRHSVLDNGGSESDPGNCLILHSNPDTTKT